MGLLGGGGVRQGKAGGSKIERGSVVGSTEGEGCVKGVGGRAGEGEGLRQVVASMRWSGGGGNNLHFLYFLCFSGSSI